MSAVLSAKFSGIDGLSDIFDKIANSGKKATEQLEAAGRATNAAFSEAAKSSNKLAESVNQTQNALKNNSAASEQCVKSSVELSKAADSVNSTYADMREAMESIDLIAKEAAGSDKLSIEAKNKLANADDNLTAAAKKLIQTQNEAVKAADNLAKVTNDEKSSQTDIEKAVRQAAKAADDLTKANQNAAKATRAAGEAASEAAEEVKAGGVEAVNALSQALAAAGLMQVISFIEDGFKAVVGAAIEFESAITGVYKTVDGSSSQLRQIRDDIKAMSTEMPASAVQISSVAEAAGQLGVATKDVTAFTEVMINLGEATNLSADTAASSLAKFVNITGMAAKDYERLGSAVVALGNNFATTEADIVGMATRMASAGTLAGLTEPQILALAASMSSVGIEADAGGSAMSKLLTDMQVAVETGSDRLNQFASVAGMTAEQFAKSFGDNAAGALYSFIAGLNDTARNGATATVVLQEMEITEVRLSNAVKSLANNSGGLNSALALADSAWKSNTALAAEAGLRYATLESRMSMASNASVNLSAAIGDDLTPVIGGFVDAGTGVMKWLTGVVEKYPAVSAVITGVGVGVGVAAAALTTFSVVTSPMVVTAIKSITKAMSENPVVMLAIGVTTLTAAAIAFTAVMASQKTEYDTWTASTKQQYDEIQRLNAEYDAYSDKAKENSAAAQDLRYRIDELTESFEDNKMTSAELNARYDEAAKQHNELMQSHSESAKGIKDEELGTSALIIKLSELASKTGLTVGEQAQMAAMVDRLNTKLPDLGLSYDKVANSLNKTGKALRQVAEEEYKRRKQEADIETYLGLLEEEERLKENVKLATAEAAAAQTAYDISAANASGNISAEAARKTGLEYLHMSSALEKANKDLEKQENLLKTNQSKLKRLEKSSEEYSAAAAELEKAQRPVTAAHRENEKVLKEVTEASDALIASNRELVESYKSSMTDISAQENGITVLISKLKELQNQENLTPGEQFQMAAVIDGLNEKIPEYGLAYDKVTGKINKTIEAIQTAGKAESNRQKQTVQSPMYANLLAEEETLKQQLSAAKEVRNMAWDSLNTARTETPGLNLSQLEADKNEAQKFYDEILHSYSENQVALFDIRQSWNEQANALVDYETAARNAVSGVSDDLQKLIDSYDKTYTAAYNSISSTVGLFNKMETESSLTIWQTTQAVKDMSVAFESQQKFIETYTSNIEKASQYKLSDGLIASLSDGSKESAGYINEIVSHIENLNPEKAGEFVTNFNKQFEGVQIAKDNFASTVEEMQNGFGSKMDAMKDHLALFVEEMNMSDKAAKAAKDTASAYIDAMKAAIQGGYADIKNFSDFSSGIVDDLVPKYYVSGIEMDARGTTNAANMFIAGEKGPELIVGAAGSTVFPADHTAKILDAASKMTLNVPAPENLELSRREIRENISTSEKKITIDLNGFGEIKVDGNLSDEDVWDIVAPRLKSEFISIIQQEIFEEGDRSYDF